MICPRGNRGLEKTQKHILLMGASKTRAQALQEEIDGYRARIVAASDEILSISKEILALIGVEGKEADRAELKEREKSLKEEQAMLTAQQTIFEELLKSSRDELAKLEGKVVYSGTAKVHELISPSLEGALPPLDQLAARLETKLPVNFPLDEYIFETLENQCRREGKRAENNVLMFLEKSTMPFPPNKLIMNWLVRDFGAVVNGKSKACIHAAITPAVQDVLDFFLDQAGSKAEFSRNGTESGSIRRKTTSGALRPDFLMHIHNLLAFRGEEKKQDVSIATAIRELTLKMENWNPLFFGDIPYIFGYALAGTQFQLYALHPNGRPQRGVGVVRTMSTSISKKLNLSKVLDRILLLQYMVNLTRVFQAIAKMVPEDAPKLGGKYEIPKQYSGKYSTLVFETAFVEKVLLNMLGSMAHFDFDTLKELYKLVQENKVVNTIKCKKNYPELSDDGKGASLMILRLYPLGRCILPNSAESLKACLLTVLEALGSMHANQFVHRDVRWPNILQLANNTWMLIDLDYARKMDSTGVAPWPFWLKKYVENGVVWPPRNGADEGWGMAKDVWMVGQLLEDMDDPIDGVDFNSLATEIKHCKNCEEAKTVVSRVLLV